MTTSISLTAFTQLSQTLRSSSPLRGTKMSSLVTPLSTNFSKTKDPKKPAPPVTRIFLPFQKDINQLSKNDQKTSYSKSYHPLRSILNPEAAGQSQS